MIQLIPQDRVSDRVDEQIIDCPVPQIRGAKCGIVESRRSTAWATAHSRDAGLADPTETGGSDSALQRTNASWSTPSPFVTRGFRTGWSTPSLFVADADRPGATQGAGTRP